MIKKYRNTNKNISQFIPKNPKKYIGSYPILCRSTWERMFYQWCDVNNLIVKWSSENIAIRYWDPVQQRTRRYYPDAYIKILNKNNDCDEYIIEIKPAKETKPPVKRGRMTEKTFRWQQAVWATNQAKFKAAREYCQKLGMNFKILTEKQLFT